MSTIGGRHERLVAESTDPNWTASGDHVEDRARAGIVGIASGYRHFGEHGSHPGRRRLIIHPSRGIFAIKMRRAALVGGPYARLKI